MIKDLIEEHRAAIEAHAEACAAFRGLLSLGHRPVVYEEERPSGWGWGVDVYERVIWSGPLGAAYAEKKRAWIRRRRALDALQQAEAAKAISRGRTPGIR
jgi:hypothetical protein